MTTATLRPPVIEFGGKQYRKKHPAQIAVDGEVYEEVLPQPAPQPQKTYVTYIIDESGSMSDKRDVVINGFNEYIENLKKAHAKDTYFSLIKFHSKVTTVFSHVPLNIVRKLTKKDYRPDHLTALLDAIGTGINALDPLVTPTDRALVVIMTDGQENHSKEFIAPQIKEMIETRERCENWSFVYMGAGPDTFMNAQRLGISWGNTMPYVPDAAGTQSAIRTLSHSTAQYSASPLATTNNFFADTDPGSIDSVIPTVPVDSNKKDGDTDAKSRTPR